VGGRTAQLHIGPIAFKAPRQRVLAFALLIAIIIIIALIAAAAASAVLLSLPHGLQSQPV
jgi:fatty acid desaturase